MEVDDLTLKKLRDYLHHCQTDMVELLRNLASLESPTEDLSAQFSMFHSIDRCLMPIGFRSRYLRGKDSGGICLFLPTGKWNRRNIPRKRQLIVGHVDTVWPKGSLGKMPVHLSNGRLYGPGVFDMKGGIVQAIFALQALDWLNLRPEFKPVLLLNSDEEKGSPDSRGIVKQVASQCERALIVEPPVGQEGLLKTERKGGGFLRLTIEGRAAHAGLNPEQGRNAIDQMILCLHQLAKIRDDYPRVTFNLGSIRGGVAANVVAPDCEVEVDIRITDSSDLISLKNRLPSLALGGDGFTVRLQLDLERPPLERNSRNQMLWHLSKRVAQHLGFNLQETSVGGGSDGNFTSEVCATLDGLGAVGGNAHQEDEYVVVDELPRRAALLAAILMEKE